MIEVFYLCAVIKKVSILELAIRLTNDIVHKNDKNKNNGNESKNNDNL
jgi:hypothetical protein